MIFRNALFLFSFLIAVTLASQVALAKSKPHMFGWPQGHEDWVDAKHHQPYLENAKHPHPAQWATKDWYAEDWISQRRSGLDLVQGFYKSDIIRNQDVDDDIAILIVGPNFYRLSGYDKRRVVHTIDVVYGVTKAQPDATIELRDWHTRRPIGVFTNQGLMLQ
jgi:hypothetical protein